MSTFADPSADKDREKSVTVEFVCTPQPVPPEAMSGLPFRPVGLEDRTVAPRAETSGQVTWLTWTIRVTGMTAPGGVSAEGPQRVSRHRAGPRSTRWGGLRHERSWLPEGRPPDPAPPRGVVGPLWWVLSPLDYRTHVLAEGDQPVGVVVVRCGAVVPVVFSVRDQPSPRPCPPCEVALGVYVGPQAPVIDHDG